MKNISIFFSIFNYWWGSTFNSRLKTYLRLSLRLLNRVVLCLFYQKGARSKKIKHKNWQNPSYLAKPGLRRHLQPSKRNSTLYGSEIRRRVEKVGRVMNRLDTKPMAHTESLAISTEASFSLGFSHNSFSLDLHACAGPKESMALSLCGTLSAKRNHAWS